MDILDSLGAMAPFLVFVTIIILGNLADRKKPKVKMKTRPFPQGQPLPDIKPPSGGQLPADIARDVQIVLTGKTPELPSEEPPEHRPHSPMEYEEVHNPYQRYLERHQEKAAVRTKPARKRVLDEQQSTSASAGAWQGMSLAQAIVATEVLAKPKALERLQRRRH